MENNTTQQEVLIFTGTDFITRQYCERETNEKSKNLSPKEKLEEACWNGFVKEVMPEIFSEMPKNDLYLWQLREANCFISLEMGEYPSDVDSFYSVDPYLFMLHQSGN